MERIKKMLFGLFGGHQLFKGYRWRARPGWRIAALTLGVCLFTVLVSVYAQAAVSKYITYQGKLTDADGNPLTRAAGAIGITVKIYVSATGGTALFTENHMPAVSNGIFNIVIGTLTSGGVNLAFDEDYWVELVVGGQTLTPRQRLTIIGYALRSNIADSLKENINIIVGSLTANGNTTLGDASADTLTFNASTLSIPNSLNIDSNTFYIDATNNKVGIGTTLPTDTLHVVGDILATSGVHIGADAANNLIDDASGGTGSTTLYIGNEAIATAGSGGNIYGTTNYVAKFTSSTDIGDSLIYDDGSYVGIGTTDPSSKLQVSGTVTATGLDLGTGNSIDVPNAAGNGVLWIENTGAETQLPVLYIADKTKTYYWKIYSINNHQVLLGTNDLNFYPGGQSTNMYEMNTAAFLPAPTQTLNFGGASNYWHYTYTDRLYLNSTAYLDGAAAGTVAITGNVGIGTSLPTDTLHVVGDILATSGVHIGADAANNLIDDASGGTGSTTLYIGNEAIATAGSGGNIYGTTNYVAKFTSSTDIGNSLIYDDGSYVGIGTTSPSEKLEVVGNVKVTGATGEIIFSNGATIENSSSTLLNLTETNIALTGNVGIGTTNPGQLLHLYNWRPAIVLEDSTSAEDDAYLVANSDNFYINRNAVDSGTRFMVELDTGNVGIGTTLPTDTLHVVGDILATSGVHIGADAANNLIDDASGGTGSTTLYIGNEAIATAGSGGNIYGTTNYVPKFTSSTDIGDSLIYDNGTYVGIGTTSPLEKLHIEGNTRTDGTYLVEDQAGDFYMTQLTDAPGTTDYSIGMRFQGSPNILDITNSWGKVQLIPGSGGALSTNYVTVDTNGYVGIGTTSPGEKLHVEGKIKVSNNTISAEEVTLDGETTMGMRITNDYGYVNITPLNTGWAHLYTDRANFIFNKRVYIIGGALSTYSTADMFLQTNGTTRLTILNSNGNVGIGTTAPELKLHVYTSGADNHILSDVAPGDVYDSLFTMRVVGETVWNLGIDTSDANKFKIANGGVWNNLPSGTRLTIDGSGYVGIGTTSPGAKLDVRGNVQIPDADTTLSFGSDVRQMINLYSTLYGIGIQSYTQYYRSGGNFAWYIGGTHSDTELDAGTGGTAAMVIKRPNGYVGIGTTAPAGKFTVTGTSAAYAGSGVEGIAQFTTGTGVNIDEKIQFGVVDGSYGWIQVVKPGTSVRPLVLNPGGGYVGIGTTSPTETLHVLGGTVGARYFDVEAGVGYGVRFWNADAYAINMGNAAEFQYGPVTDYSIKMNMNNTAGRGWTWGIDGATPVAALSNTGIMQIASDFTCGPNVYVNGSTTRGVLGGTNLDLQYDASNLLSIRSGTDYWNIDGAWRYRIASTYLAPYTTNVIDLGTATYQWKNLYCAGTKSSVVKTSMSENTLLFAVESPEVYFEDMGETELKDGYARVEIDKIFKETVNTDAPYQIFLTPYSDCKGLYIAERTPDYFVVKELQGGRSTLRFGYRIIAKREGYESYRFAKE